MINYMNYEKQFKTYITYEVCKSLVRNVIFFYFFLVFEVLNKSYNK